MKNMDNDLNEWLPNQNLKGITKNQKFILGAMLFFLLIFVYMLLQELLKPILFLPKLPGGSLGKMIPPMLFALLYLTYTRGIKSTSFLFFFLIVYCWATEALSVNTGFPFGHYYYSDALGYKIAGSPVSLGFNYLWLLVFPAFYVANLLAQGTFLDMGKGWKGLIFTSFIASILIAGIDMVVDPLDATKLSEWVWTKNAFTGYYGIPYVNYLGYIIVETPLFVIFGLMQRKFKAKPIGPVNIWIAIIPLLFYFMNFLMYASLAPSGVLLVGCFTMIFPLIMSIDRLLKYFSKSVIK